MRRGSVVFVVTLVVAFVATGGLRALARRSPRALSHAQFVTAADGACYHAAESFPPIKADKPYPTFLRADAPVLSRMRSSLSGLEPPQDDAASFQLMLHTLDRYLLADSDMLRFWETDQLRVYKAALRQEASSVRLRRLSAKLGLGWCRWVWTWHPRQDLNAR